jgi:tetratricopeptide (TPR) repeat protein|tara:strand:- start:54 stop:497 length:444 start_codon:yes stop_codon:yes gene_type:complete
MSKKLNKLDDGKLEKFNKTIMVLKKSLKAAPRNHNLYISLGNEYLKLRRFELAFQSYFSAYNLEPQNADISVCIGVFHREVGNYNDAASALLNAIKLDKNCIKAYVDLSDVYFNLGQHKKGLEYLYKVDGVIQFDLNSGLSVFKGNI